MRGSGGNEQIVMIYTLKFKCHGRAYSNSQTVPGKFLPNQYEAVVCGLLLWKIEQENLSREDKYVDLSLIEYNENDGNVVNPVWTAQTYVPISEEVK